MRPASVPYCWKMVFAVNEISQGSMKKTNHRLLTPQLTSLDTLDSLVKLAVRNKHVQFFGHVFEPRQIWIGTLLLESSHRKR